MIYQPTYKTDYKQKYKARKNKKVTKMQNPYALTHASTVGSSTVGSSAPYPTPLKLYLY